MKPYLFCLRVLACLAIFFAAFSLSCRPKTPAESEEPSPDRIEAETDVSLVEPNTTDETTADSVAVTVNGIDITESEVEELIKPQLDRMAKQSSNQTPAFVEQFKKMLKQQALEVMITGRLLDEEVKEANIVVTEEEVIGQIGKIASAQRPPLSLEDFKKKLEEYGSFDRVKQEVRKGLGYQKFMETQWVGKIDVTEEEAKKNYDENPKQFEMPEQVRASHILITPDTVDPNTDPNQAKAGAKAKIQDLLKQVKEGADFAEVAKANSACPSAAQGGDLNFFPRGRMAAPFEEAAFELETGQLSDIVETSFGYHIIKVTDRKDASLISFEQAKDNIISKLAQKKQSEFTKKYIESLKVKADIFYPPGKEPSSVTGRP
ncbi:MAG: peptidylprolyl isomerase [Planctomycetota bacterium]